VPTGVVVGLITGTTVVALEYGLESTLAYDQKTLLWKQYGVPGAAVHYGGDSRLVADSARAVGDGDCLGL
jgi:hypothetical protein